MDIALNNDLIEIQELIANPPAPSPPPARAPRRLAEANARNKSTSNLVSQRANLGRRHERSQQMDQLAANGRPLHNCQSRPLAALDDPDQLYAVPHKLRTKVSNSATSFAQVALALTSPLES